MENGALIGALAIFTIGAMFVGALVYFGFFLRDPRNREHAHRTLVEDGPAASSEHQDKDGFAPLKQRLEHSEASSHAYDPSDPGKRAEAR